MWFLEIDQLLIITALVLFIGILRAIGEKLKVNIPINFILPVIQLGILFFISRRLAIFYILYIFITYILAIILFKATKFREILFLIFCLLASSPFIISRFVNLGIIFNTSFIIIGIAYVIFKVIDIYYHIYYSGDLINLLVYINYILFLPVFTSGPIHRYREFEKTLRNPILFNINTLSNGIQRLIRGLFKKLVVVEVLLIFFNHLQTIKLSWYISLSIITLSYMVLYFDLSGYSDIAIALGSFAGIMVPENFKKPWSAPSMTQFWRNWHVTLSDFIREHIYIVVAKKRLNKIQAGIIGFFTMIIMSLWHGFNILYIFAGIYLGIILFLENTFSLTSLNKKTTNKFYYTFRCLLTNLLFGINTLVFTLPKDKVLAVIQGLFKI